MISLTILATAVQNQAAAARREFHPLSPFLFWGYPRPPPRNYQGLTDYDGVKMHVGIDHFFDSERKDWRLHKFINCVISSPDTRTILPDHLWYSLEGSHILCVPTPGDPDKVLFDSVMQSVKDDEEARGYSINADDPAKQIHRGNQVSQRNIAFPKVMVEVFSVMIYVNNRGPISNCSKRWYTQSDYAAINLCQIQNCLIKCLIEVMLDIARRVFPGKRNITTFLGEAFLFLT